MLEMAEEEHDERQQRLFVIPRVAEESGLKAHIAVLLADSIALLCTCIKELL